MASTKLNTNQLNPIHQISAPQGFLINGKIVPSVASNNLTVAIKGMDGNDPSASNPVYCRIGDTIRSITAALSVTKNAGTNWCNAGGAELATKEIDYFVYLGYNATDGVVIGFSRIPYATLYSDFSATAAEEKYCGISTITNAAAGDNYENIGRFAATLSAGAGYTWTVPTFTTKNLIQRPIYETRKLTYVSVTAGYGGNPTLSSITGTSTYRVISNRCVCDSLQIYTKGGTASSIIQVTLPFKIGVAIGIGLQLLNNGAQEVGSINSSTATNIAYVRRYSGANYNLEAGGQHTFSNVSYEIE